MKKSKFKLGGCEWWWINLGISLLVVVGTIFADRGGGLGYNFTQTEAFIAFSLIFILLNQLTNFLSERKK